MMNAPKIPATPAAIKASVNNMIIALPILR